MKAVVVDSVAAPFRGVEGMQWKHQPVMLATIGRMLHRIAARGIAVVVLNQVVGGATSNSSDVKPALGTGPVLSMLSWNIKCIRTVGATVRVRY